jgi:GT2 family glycosyltransferase
MNRPELTQALESVNKQSYDNVEVVLVDASGKGLTRHQGLDLRFQLREVSTGQQLNRSAAANLALQNASGDFLFFLDEDDWISEDHIEQLAAVLEQNSRVGVAYSSTQITTANGELTEDIFDIEYDPARLRRDNFIPIHSALFRKSLLGADVGFDDNLEIFEDWDFWLQLAARTDFVHIKAVTAFYRRGGESNTASDDPMTRYQPGHLIACSREKVFDKWLPHWNGAQLNQTLGSLDKASLALHSDIRRLNDDLALLHNQARTLNQNISKLNHSINRKQAELQEARAVADQYWQHIQLLQSSLSWRITGPLRWLRRKIDGLRQQTPASVPQQQVSGPVRCCLDSPGGTQREFAEHLTLAGWCCSKNGINRIEAWIDGNLAESFSNGVSRPDVAELFPDLPDIKNAGFYHEISLQDQAAGAHKLELRVYDNANEHASIVSEFTVLKSQDIYNAWYWRNTPDQSELAAIKVTAGKATATAASRFHILITDVNDEAALRATVSSLTEQAWPHWNLHIHGERSKNIDDISAQWHKALNPALETLGNQNAWIIILRAGEILAPHALYEFAALTQSQPNLRLVYSDHDLLDESGDHSEPVFTPQWSPEHLLCSNYIGEVFVFSSDLLPSALSLDTNNPAWRYGLLLDVANKAGSSGITRVPAMLWSANKKVIPANLPQHETAVLRRWLANKEADAEVLERDGYPRAVLWPLKDTPKVSIIIPTMGKMELVKPCIDSLLDKTTYPNYEVIILDNGRGKYPDGIQYLRDKQFKVIEVNEPFNWARLNNIGTRHADGDLYLFLNDDIEITSGDWLHHLVRQAQREDVGAVGALLYYPNGALQHTGVMLVNYGGGGIHLFHKRTPSLNIYRQLHQTVREVSANTGACLMVTRQKFEKIGGFDEELAVVGNDVDLCLRLLEQGYRNIWTPLCNLIHHESISRKKEVPKEDEKAMWQRWGKRFIAGDDYYNPNLSSESCDFSLQANSVRVSGSANFELGTTRSHSVPQIPGVNLIGYTRAEMGIGEGARSDARALDAVDEAFGIICVTSGNPSRMGDLSWQHKELDSTPYDVTLLHVNPDHALQVISELPPEYFDDHYRIGYWAWELPIIPKDWEKAFLHFDEIWVPSGFVQDAVAAKSPVPVVRIPHAIEVRHDAAITRKHFGLPENRLLFLMMFDTHSRQERKNPYGAIAAFRKAFAPDDSSVGLVIKVNNASAEALASLKEKTGSHQNIFFLDKVYSRMEVNSLIASCDCFLSLHRSEGFGFGPAEAMALGKVVIATYWSGNSDYMRPDNSICVNYTLTMLEDDYGPYNKGQIWAEPDVDHAALSMKSLAENPQTAAQLGAKAKQTIEEEFSPAAVGKLMKNRLATIRQIRTQD